MQHRPRKRFGQNFLHDDTVINKIVQAINPQAQDHVVEIGPGLGALTHALLAKKPKLDVIEIDRDLLASLNSLANLNPNLAVHQADALQFDFQQLVLSQEKLRIVGNLPYNISTPLLFHLIAQIVNIKDMHFMLQKEVVERLTAKPSEKAYGRLSVMVQYFCQTSYLFTVAPQAFYPAPKVESAVVRLIPHASIPLAAYDFARFSQIVLQAFNQRRKTLHNSLKKLLSSAQITSCGIDGNIRPEQLTVQDFVRLANA